MTTPGLTFTGHLIPPALSLLPTRSLCRRAEARLVSLVHAGAVEIPSEMKQNS